MSDSYKFRLLKFNILNTRSPLNDTDHVAFALKLGDQALQGPLIVHTGDVGNGDHFLNLQFGLIPVDAGTPVMFNFQILNSGHSNQSDIEKALFSGADALSKAAIASGNPLAIGAGVIAEIVKAIFDLDCDGPVAIDQVNVTGQILQNLTPTGIHTETRICPGLDSKDFCGTNSSYTVSWSVVRTSSDAPRLTGLVHLQNIGD